MTKLKRYLGKSIIITSLVILLNACATEEVKTNSQPETKQSDQQLLETKAAMACEAYYRYPMITREYWRMYVKNIKGCFKTGEMWKYPEAVLICPVFPVLGTYFYVGASIGSLLILDPILALIPKKCSSHLPQ